MHNEQFGSSLHTKHTYHSLFHLASSQFLRSINEWQRAGYVDTSLSRLPSLKEVRKIIQNSVTLKCQEERGRTLWGGLSNDFGRKCPPTNL